MKAYLFLHIFRRYLFVCFGWLAVACTMSYGQTLTVVAGDGTKPIGQFGQLRDVCVDRAGNLFVADFIYHKVSKVDPSGQVTVIAGTGKQGYSGDGGPATLAQLGQPRGLFVDALGNIFIAEHSNHCIRKVDPSGIISTVAGTGTRGYSGDGGPATLAQLSVPGDVFVDPSGNLFIADRSNHRVRKVDQMGVITTVAGSGLSGYAGDGGLAVRAQLNLPNGIFVDRSGNLFIATDHSIRKVDKSGVISTVAGTGSAGTSGDGDGDGGPATLAQLAQTCRVIVDKLGNMLIAEAQIPRVSKVDNSGMITTIVGNGSVRYFADGVAAVRARIGQPLGIDIDRSGNIFFSTRNGYVRRVDASGMITTVAGNGGRRYSGDGGPATRAQLSDRGIEGDVAVDGFGNLFITDDFHHSIRKIDASGLITTVAGNGTAGYSGDGGSATLAQLNTPKGVFVDGHGNLFIADALNDLIRKVDASGVITTVAGNGTRGFAGDGGLATLAQLYLPSGIFVDKAGDLLIADQLNHRIRKVDRRGVITTVAGSEVAGYSGDQGPATDARLKRPVDVVADLQGNLYIADMRNFVVRKVDVTGRISTVAGNGVRGYSGDQGPATLAQLVEPNGLFVDGSDRLFIADRTSIRKVDRSGEIITVIGTRIGERAGAGELAIRARLTRPSAIVGDAEGNLFIRDLKNNRVVKVSGTRGAYAIRQYQTDRYLFEDGDTYRVQTLETQAPSSWHAIWNVTSQGAAVVIQNAASRKHMVLAHLGGKATDTFLLKDTEDGAVRILSELDNARGLAVSGKHVVLDTVEKESKWELVRLGETQAHFLNTAGQIDLEQDPHALNDRQVLIGIDGYVYGTDGREALREDFRWLRSQNGWITASEKGIIYDESQLFTLEYLGSWSQLLEKQNAYAENCNVLKMSKHVFVLKARDGTYIQPEGVATKLNFNTGLPPHTIVHLSAGEQGGVRPKYKSGTPERDKAALFGIDTKRYADGEWIDDGQMRLQAISHQWTHTPGFVEKVFDHKEPAMPIWGIVAPISLYTLQALHNLHESQPWPENYDPPSDHWLAAYPLGASLPDDSDTHRGHFTSQVCFVNQVKKERVSNFLLGITLGWKYWFHAHPGTALRLFVLNTEKDAQQTQMSE